MATEEKNFWKSLGRETNRLAGPAPFLAFSAAPCVSQDLLKAKEGILLADGQQVIPKDIHTGALKDVCFPIPCCVH